MGLAGVATPVPIPDTEVMPSQADDTAAERQRESRTLAGYNKGLLVVRSADLSFLSRQRQLLAGRKGEGGESNYDATMKNRRYEQARF